MKIFKRKMPDFHVRQRCLWLIFLLFFTPALFAAELPTITLYVTVDWEGWSLDDENIEAMQAFRKKYPHIPILQFLNPVYFLRSNVDAAATTKKIHSTLLPFDEQGLHIHAWKSLIERCNVPYKSEPSFADVVERCDGGECGYSVSLEYAYSQPELTKLVACSADLMVQQGFKRPKSFRAGGWQLGPKLASALQANGFIFDSSRIDAQLLTTKWGEKSGIVQMVKALHADSTILDQPFVLLEGLTEYPNNAGLADYTSTEQLVEIFRSLIASKKSVMVLGFHQETAFNYLGRLEQAIPLMEKEADAAGVKLKWAHYQQ